MANNFTFMRTTPEEQGIESSGIQKLIEAFEKKTAGRNDMELHSIMVLRHGNVVAEGWWAPNAPQYRHILYSLSKSFTSTAIGFAVAEGRISIEDQVISYFEEDLPQVVNENLAAMRIRNLLTMSTGHDEDTELPMYEQAHGTWARTFLTLAGGHAPGTRFLYNTGASYMLSSIIQKVTGMKMLDYLRPRLFEPLGIINPVWEDSPEGINIGGYGLYLKTEDIARFGQFYLQKGMWEGRQLLPLAWIEQATSKQISNGPGPESGGDWEQGYGYQFWMCRHGAYRGDGAFGQYCFVLPEQDVVIAVTSAVSDMGLMFDLLWKHLLPAIHKDTLPENETEYTALLEKLSSLTLPVPSDKLESTSAEKVSGKVYILDENEFSLDKISFRFMEKECSISMNGKGVNYGISCGIGQWIEGKTKETCIAAPFDYTNTAFTAGAWEDTDTFRIVLRLVESPHYNIITCKFEGGNLHMDIALNLIMLPYEVKPLTGRLE